MREPATAYVALGANLGEPVAALVRAVLAIDALPQTQVLRQSSLYRSAPLDSSGPDYVNAVIAVSTGLCAPDLLLQLQKIEQAQGRERPWPNAPRTLDLDLLLYGSASLDSPSLTVPHPRMAQRAFVLLPLSDIARQWLATANTPAIAEQRIERFQDSRWVPSSDPSS